MSKKGKNDFEDTETADIMDDELERVSLKELNDLILQGPNAVVHRDVKVYIPQQDKYVLYESILRGLTQEEWSSIQNKVTGKKNRHKNFKELICATGWLKDETSGPLPLSEIKRKSPGLVSQIYYEIKKISGMLDDPEEEKYYEKLADF